MQARMSLHLSKCHIVGNLMLRLYFIFMESKASITPIVGFCTKIANFLISLLRNVVVKLKQLKILNLRISNLRQQDHKNMAKLTLFLENLKINQRNYHHFSSSVFSGYCQKKKFNFILKL